MAIQDIADLVVLSDVDLIRIDIHDSYVDALARILRSQLRMWVGEGSDIDGIGYRLD